MSGESGNCQWLIRNLRPSTKNTVKHLLANLLGQLIRLLALDAQGGHRQGQVALVQRLGPLEDRVNDFRVDTAGLSKQLGDVGAVDVQRVVLGVRVGRRRDIGDAEALESGGQLVDGSHGECSEGLSCGAREWASARATKERASEEGLPGAAQK